MLQLTEEFKALARSIEDEVIHLRRELHQYPELSWKEFKTAAILTELLRDAGLDVREGICSTGIVAEIDTGQPGNTIAVRADMDALPMNDDKEVPYASRVPGSMHACGHDAHMAMAFGVAKVFQKANPPLTGKIRFIFQPSEEAAPSGAEELVKENVMEGVDRIFAFHVDPEIEVGRIGLRSGMLTATCNEFHMTLHGKSGHGARPHQSIDTIYIASQVLPALYDIVNSRSQPYIPAVLSVGQIHGGTKANVIPERVQISGTLRTIDPKSSNEIFDAIEERVSAITRAAGGHFQIEFTQNIPGVFNDHGCIEAIRDVFSELYGNDNVVSIKSVSMGGEDFSWYLSKAPGALIRLGSRTPGTEVRYLHTNDFDIDERALAFGIEVMCSVVADALQS